MSIKQGDYLKKLRVDNNLSQEKLGELLGLSRQSISKWEQGYASPDTDNLLKLSKIYNISVDDILNCGETIQNEVIEEKEDNVAVEDIATEEIPVDVEETKVEEIKIESPKKEKRKRKKRGWIFYTCPWLVVICIAIFSVYSGTLSGFLYSLTFLLVIPIFYTAIFAIEKKNALIFCYPALLTLAYLAGGYIADLWHPLWLIFLTIPIYYIAAAVNRKNKKRK